MLPIPSANDMETLEIAKASAHTIARPLASFFFILLNPFRIP